MAEAFCPDPHPCFCGSPAKLVNYIIGYQVRCIAESYQCWEGPVVIQGAKSTMTLHDTKVCAVEFWNDVMIPARACA